MKIYNKIVLDIATGDTICEDSYIHDGVIALCKGGGSTQTSTVTKEIDYAYNARMADIAEQQQAIANEYADFWRETYKPLEIAQVAANLQLTEAQTAQQLEAIAAQRSLVPVETELTRSQMELGREYTEAQRELLPEEMALRKEGIGTLRGLTEKAAGMTEGLTEAGVGRAVSETAQQFGKAREELGRTQTPFRRGGALQDLAAEEAKARIQAVTGARELGEEKEFRRTMELGQTIGQQLGG